MITTVALDVGETLISDDRVWAGWADWLGVRRHTVSALVGAVVAQGRDNADALRQLRPGLDVAAAYEAREAAGRGEELTETDLYEDVRPALAALRAAGLRVVVAGNQTIRAAGLLRALDLPVDLIATSGEWGVAKPEAAFFDRLVQEADATPDQVVYVGDHPANDLFPAVAAGLRTAHLRRGPWGHYWADDPAVVAAADWRIGSLEELLPIVGH
ncbi:HAD family hydrolase [Actinacidiphila sp. ITFR-21]|uniref:HAD family hydrolase n=1 Tax=Actinacidiphila sp. ITFR-21 TaxID=3075199 RepID=UPI00288A6FD1|nr:HAD family hydrolase [Streptomyces sp. ITFR-21]WNI16601.1 HAD family hydrolase [Streptomyces sp. ITFR-21]